MGPTALHGCWDLSSLSLLPQELDPLGASSLVSRWGTPSRHPNCQVSQKEDSRHTTPRASLLRSQHVGDVFFGHRCLGRVGGVVRVPEYGRPRPVASKGSHSVGTGLPHTHRYREP